MNRRGMVTATLLVVIGASGALVGLAASPAHGRAQCPPPQCPAPTTTTTTPPTTTSTTTTEPTTTTTTEPTTTTTTEPPTTTTTTQPAATTTTTKPRAKTPPATTTTTTTTTTAPPTSAGPSELTLDAPAASPGGSGSISGRGCPPDSEVGFRLEGERLGGAVTGGDGRFETTLEFPEFPVGRHSLIATCGGGQTAIPIDLALAVNSTGIGSAGVATVLVFFLLLGILLRPATDPARRALASRPDGEGNGD
ncbi:MAG: hypothetical protein HYU28_09425 [Actinobacteria bacterium]|nr:hypothetical protein [Actinomycetota bacterium]